MKFLLQLAVVTCLGLLVGWGLVRYVKGNEKVFDVRDGKYDYDSPLDPEVPSEARLEQEQRLALVVGVSRSSLVPEYLGVLQRKYQPLGLKVLVVIAPDSPRALALLTGASGIPWVLDSDGRFQHLLRFSASHRHDAVLIYDSHYKVKFHLLGMADNDLLRQLVEKYLVGSITYKPSELLASSLVGRRIEGLQCTSEPAPSKGVFVVFPAGCSSCELNSYREQLRTARKSQWASSRANEKWTLIFVNGKDARVLTQVRDLGFSEQDICAVRQDILLDPYQTRKSPDTVPLLIRTGEDGVITEVRDLSAFSSGGSE